MHLPGFISILSVPSIHQILAPLNFSFFPRKTAIKFTMVLLLIEKLRWLSLQPLGMTYKSLHCLFFFLPIQDHFILSTLKFLLLQLNQLHISCAPFKTISALSFAWALTILQILMCLFSAGHIMKWPHWLPSLYRYPLVVWLRSSSIKGWHLFPCPLRSVCPENWLANRLGQKWQYASFIPQLWEALHSFLTL